MTKWVTTNKKVQNIIFEQKVDDYWNYNINGVEVIWKPKKGMKTLKD